MAYNRTQRWFEPIPADPEACNENKPADAGSQDSNTRAFKSPPSDPSDSAADEKWSVVHPSTRHKTGNSPFGHVDQAPLRLFPRVHNLNGPDCIIPPRFSIGPVPKGEVPISTDQLQLGILRRHIGVGTAQSSQAPDPVAAAKPSGSALPVRSFTIPIREPRIPGCIHPSASRSVSSPEERSPERAFYRPMSGIAPKAWSPPKRAPCRPASLATHGAPGDPVSLATGNSDFRGTLVATNDSTYSDLRKALLMLQLGFSPAYNGDPHLERNRSANVPDDLNCSLFLVNLPPNLTTNRLITAVHAMGPTGRIYATHINAPEPDRQHFGCAAKVIFFERRAAHHFFDLCEQYGFTVDGFTARVMWNRIKTAEQAHSRVTTRVLLIGGHRDFVNPAALTEYFRTKLQFQIDRIIPHNDGMNGQNAVVEYRFGSFRCQAEAAKMALGREHQDVRCFFYPDPCDPSHPDWTQADFVRPRNRPRRFPNPLGAVPEEEEAQESDSLFTDFDRYGFP